MIGLKLWSINTDYYLDCAKKLYNEGIFDYIELYYVPNTLKTLEKWRNLNIPFTLHAPHYEQRVNLADKNKEKFNTSVYRDVAIFKQELKAKYVIVHGGMLGTPEEAIRQIKLIKLDNILIENKPYIAPLDNALLCRGATYDEVKFIIDKLACGFCFDIGHAICAYNSLRDSIKLDLYEYLSLLNSLNPTCYHISDNYIESPIDRHLHFGTGNYDFKRLKQIFNPTKDICIETCKNSKTNLDDYVQDVLFLKRIIL